jgi:hypothetical protein
MFQESMIFRPESTLFRAILGFFARHTLLKMLAFHSTKWQQLPKSTEILRERMEWNVGSSGSVAEVAIRQ